MPEAVIELKNRVAHYKELIKAKEELEKEYQDWMSLTEEMRSVLDKVKTVYDAEQTEEAKTELDKWLKEEKDYLEIIDEYVEKFKELNEELSQYSTDIIEAEREYLANLTRFQEISDKMKEIEKRSKKIANGASIGTNCIKLENAEGRKKNIHIYFAEVYQTLSSEKRELAKVLRKQYNKLFNQVETKEIIEEEIAQEVSIPDVFKEETLPEEEIVTISLEEEKTIEERIKELETRMEELRKASGRKQRLKCYGEIVELPRINVGKYLVCARELNSLKKELEEKEKSANLESALVTEATITHGGTNDVSSTQEPKDNLEFDDLSSPFITDAPVTSLVGNSGIDIPLDEGIVAQAEGNLDPNDLSSPFITDAKETSIDNRNIYSSKKLEEKYSIDIPLDDYEPKSQTESKDEELLRMINRHYLEIENNKEEKKSEKVEEPEKENKEPKHAKKRPKGFLKITDRYKPKHAKKHESKIKKVLATAAALLCVTVMISPLMKSIIKKANPNDLGTTPPTTMQGGMLDDTKPNNSIIPDQKPVEDEKISLSLGGELVIKDGAMIYGNVYDAIEGKNARNPLFNSDLDRKVGGIAVNYEGQTYFFYTSNPNSQENIDTLIENGGKVTAVLASNSNGYEGFYNIEDVNMLNQTLGGNSR